MNRYPHKVTQVSMREARIDKFQFEDSARASFDEIRKQDHIVFACLHIGGEMVATFENTEDLDLKVGRFGGA